MSSSAATRARPGGLAVAAVRDDLSQHRVVGGGDHLAALERGIHAGAGRPAHDGRRPGLREEPAEGVLRVDPRLDRVSASRTSSWVKRQRLPVGDAELERRRGRGPTVDRDGQLGDGMLDLQPGVHLQEVGPPRGVVEQELDGAGAHVADLSREGDRRGGDVGPLLVR